MITDELREFSRGWRDRRCHVELDTIADNIDAALDDYVALPKDADGVTIHLQDRMSWDNGTFNVHELNLTADGWTTWDELHGYTVHADQCHHVTPDSWERIIEDAAKNIYPNGAFNPCWDEVRDSLVERCKRLAGEDA